MKIHYVQSIKQQLDRLFATGASRNIDFVELTESEYISFLHELPYVSQILLTDTDTKYRVYKGIRLKVLR